MTAVSESDVDRVFADLGRDYPGSWMSNGVGSILAHDSLPEHFGKEAWKDWFFKPADGAFEWAHDRGLITPWKLSSKWTFTPLGLAVAARAQEELTRDSDLSGEAIETAKTGSTEGEGAGRQASPESPSPYPGDPTHV